MGVQPYGNRDHMLVAGAQTPMLSSVFWQPQATWRGGKRQDAAQFDVVFMQG